jgi:hypothetical protein
MENHPDYIDQALDQCYVVEIDLWVNPKDFKLYLGHDAPTWEVSEAWLKATGGLLIHAKNRKAAGWLTETDLHWFWHETDALTHTSWGHTLSHVNSKITPGSIQISFEKGAPIHPLAVGICTDYAQGYEHCATVTAFKKNGEYVKAENTDNP